MLTHISWLLKSRKRFPSGVQNQQPFAPATGIGSMAPCADHSKSVCFFLRSTMIWPLRPSMVSTGFIDVFLCRVCRPGLQCAENGGGDVRRRRGAAEIRRARAAAGEHPLDRADDQIVP